ncbi:hypothetical protein [Pseudodesulfovibrio sediminis]|uniref:B30.2/SPRY domain-containing protein n=1 Tax=Pseudodesulfovibrio sediminis TaxID=2810563 RepID=A0ABN6EQH7_9BACT|nr:hypothetical protein [Pseudodesulfovibrio sediminis]BCS87324.1 hypothetical protein PSDVSF_05660 [Pseudodesulfovibrio sediminis]
MMQPAGILKNSNGSVYPVSVPYSALLESGFSSSGAVATDCTIAFGFKPTDPTVDTSHELVDVTNHYLLTIRKVDTVVTVWAQDVELSAYGGAVGSTYAEFVSNVLTEYCGSDKGYYSRLAIVESALDYTSFWRASTAVPGLWVPRGISGLTLHTRLEFGNAVDLGADTSGNGNDWTFVSADQSVDTPTNNGTTYNVLTATTSPVYHDGNVSIQGPGGWGASRSTLLSTGKWYMEFHVDTLSQSVGVRFGFEDHFLWPGPVAGGTGSYAFMLTSNQLQLIANGSSAVVLCSATTLSAGHTIGIAYDTDTGKAWVRQNETWLGTGSPAPATGTDPVYTVPTLKDFIHVASVYTSGTRITGHFSEADLEYPAPDGFVALAPSNIEDGVYDLSGSYKGNGSANGMCICTRCALDTLTINGITYTNDGTDSAVVKFLSNGFKLVSAISNVSNTVYDWTGTLLYPANTSNAQPN